MLFLFQSEIRIPESQIEKFPLPNSVICLLASVLCHLSSGLCFCAMRCQSAIEKFRLPNSYICPLSSVLCLLSSVFCPLSSVLCHQSSVLCHLTSVLYRSRSQADLAFACPTSSPGLRSLPWVGGRTPRSRAILSSSGGWVENKLIMRLPDSGLTINM
jgi:hypothetical protein